jgi:hypothetical protein
MYEWNLKLARAVLRDIAHFEVALRNAYDTAITQRWRGSRHWLMDPSSPVQAPLYRRSHGNRVDINRRNRDVIAEAVARAGGSVARPGGVIAELSFGFWRHLADTGHERTIWIPYLHRAWPSGTSRSQIDAATRLVNETRNRAAHHEPLFGGTPGRGLLHAQQEVVRLLAALLPDLGSYVQQTSTVALLLSQRP